MNRIKDSYEQIHADDELINSTISSLNHARQAKNPKVKTRNWSYKNIWKISAVLAMIAIIVLVRNYSVSTQAASYISIDATPSIELTLNKNNKVIEAKAYNESGENVLADLSLSGMDYEKALELLFESEALSSYDKDSDTYTITVVSENNKNSQVILEELKDCNFLKNHDITVTSEDTDICDEAHHNNMTAGRYDAYLKLKNYDESTSLEDCHDMSMSEIEDCIESHEEHAEDSTRETACTEEDNSECEDEQSQKDNSDHESDHEQHDGSEHEHGHE